MGTVLIVIIMFVIVVLNYPLRRQPISFRIYYDKIDATILRHMATYDVNIVEASFFEKEDVEYLHKNNSQGIGYLSLVEIGHWDTPLINDLHEEDYLVDASNEKMKSLSKSNYLGDLSSPHFREVLFSYLETRIFDKGMDGVFFDTLDWIDYYTDDARIYEKLTSGYKAFLIELRKRYPDSIVIQNRGFESYKKFSHDYIDGILWENFQSPYIEGDTEKIQTLKKFDRATKLSRTNVFVISFENEDENRKAAAALDWNFLYSQMEDRYSKWDIEVR